MKPGFLFLALGLLICWLAITGRTAVTLASIFTPSGVSVNG